MKQRKIEIDIDTDKKTGYFLFGGKCNMNEFIVISISSFLMIVSLCAIYQGQPDISYVCVGALAGFLTKDILAPAKKELNNPEEIDEKINITKNKEEMS